MAVQMGEPLGERSGDAICGECSAIIDAEHRTIIHTLLETQESK
jgi:hypothetical protein